MEKFRSGGVERLKREADGWDYTSIRGGGHIIPRAWETFSLECGKHLPSGMGNIFPRAWETSLSERIKHLYQVFEPRVAQSQKKRRD